MKTTLLIGFAIGTFLLPKALRAQSDQDIGTILPDNTSALIVFQNLTKFYELEDDHPLKKMVGHPAFKHLYGGAFDEMTGLFSEENLAELGLTDEDLARMFPGRFAMAGNLNFSMLMDISATGVPAGGNKSQANVGLNMKGISFMAIADTTLTAEELTDLSERMISASKEKSESRSFQDQFEGYPMVRIESKTVAEDGTETWAATGLILAENQLLIAPMTDNKADMTDSIVTDVARRIKARGTEPNSLAGSRSYIDARDQLEEADVFLFAPLDDIATAMETSISEFYDKTTADAAAGKGGLPIGMFVTKDGILDFLGLKDFKRYTVAAKIQPDGLEMVLELATNERNGAVSKLLNYDKGIQLPEMDPAGLKGITISGFKVSDTIEELLARIPQLSPMLGGLLQMQIGQLEAQGLNLRNGLLPAVAPGVTSIYGYATPTPAKDQVPSQALIFKTNDPIGLAASMVQITGFMKNSPLGAGAKSNEARDFMGESIYEVDSLAKIFGPMLSVSQNSSSAYAIVGDQLIVSIGEKEWMDHVIASLKKGASSLEDHETLSESWQKWGSEDMVEFGYEDLATVLKRAIYGSEEGIQVRAQTGGATPEEIKAAKTIEEMPSLEGFNYSITQKTFDTPDAWITRVYIAEKPGQ